MENDQEQPSQEVLGRLFEHRNDQKVLRAFNHRYGNGSAERYLNDTASTTLENEALVIPEADIEYLKTNSENQSSIAAFDKMHGAGQAQAILTGGNQSVPQNEGGEGKNGYVYDTLIQAPLAGIEDVADGLLKAGSWIADAGFGVKSRIVATSDLGFQIVSGEEYEELKRTGKIGDGLIDFVDDADTRFGSFVQSAATFAIPYLGIASKVAKGGKLVQGLAIGAAVDGIVIDPNDANLSAALKDMGANNAILDLIATDPDDPEWQNRFRNVVEGSVLGLAIESIFYGLKAAKAAKNGDTEAAKEFSEKSQEFAGKIDEPIVKAANEVAEDAQKTIDMVDDVFPKVDNDGQMSLDLGLQSTEQTAKALKVPYRLTSEQIENIKLMTRVGDLDPQEAARLVGLSFRSVDTLNDYDDVLAQLAATKHVMKEQFLEMRGGDVQTWSTVELQTTKKLRHMADVLGKDPEAFKQEITGGLNIPPHELAAEVLAKDRMLYVMNQEITVLSKQVAEGNSGSYGSMTEAKLALASRIEISANLSSTVDANRANVGRAMAAMKMSRVADPKLREMIKNSVSNSDIEAVAKAIANSDHPLKTALGLGKRLQKTMDMVNHYRINALLSGLGTQQVNMIGTAANSVMIPLQQIMGGQVKHGVRTLAYQLSSSLEAMKMATTTFKEDTSILDVLSTKFDMNTDIGKGSKSLPMKIVSLPSRFLLSMDEFFKQATYRGRVMADAAMKADNTGLKGAKRAEFIQDYVAKSFGSNGEAIRAGALLQSQRASFTEALEAGSMGQKFQSLGRGEGVGAAMFRFILPFVRTPINILSQSFQNMPVLQFASKRFRDDLASADPLLRAQAKGKIMTGVAITSVGYFLAGRGDFTGSGPTDFRIRAEWLKNNQPYSIKINNDDGSFYWFSYQRFEPLANVLSIFADVNEIVRDPYNERETSKMHITAALTLAIAENTVNKTFTKGLADTFGMMTGDPIKSEKAFLNMVGSFVPNILNQTNGDEAFREVRSVTDTLLSRTGLYEDVDPKRNVIGEIIMRPTNKMDPLGLSNIGNYREEDPVLAELSRVSMKDGSAFSQLSNTIFIGGKNENLKDIPYKDGPQSIFDKLLEQTESTQIDGMTVREKLAEVMVSKKYTEEAIDGTSGLGSKGTKGQMIGVVIKAYRDKAKSEIPEYSELLRRSQESKVEVIKSQLLERTPEISKNSLERFKNFDAVFPNQ